MRLFPDNAIASSPQSCQIAFFQKCYVQTWLHSLWSRELLCWCRGVAKIHHWDAYLFNVSNTIFFYNSISISLVCDYWQWHHMHRSSWWHKQHGMWMILVFYATIISILLNDSTCLATLMQDAVKQQLRTFSQAQMPKTTCKRGARNLLIFCFVMVPWRVSSPWIQRKPITWQ